MYLRCPSAKIVSKASELFPDPETPVMTISSSLGSTTSIPLRLCSLAPVTRMALVFTDFLGMLFPISQDVSQTEGGAAI